MTVTVYGIPNCDSVKKARVWLDEHGVAYRFHDVRKDGIEQTQIARWMDEVGDVVVNRRGTTWRQLSDSDKARAEGDAAALLAENPAMIKRPVIEHDGPLLVGYDASAYADSGLIEEGNIQSGDDD